MTQQETLEYNKRCAEFFGYTLRENDCYNGDDKLVAKLSYLQTADLKFHSDWNWIMEILLKIQSLPLDEHTHTIWNLKFRDSKETVIRAINQFLIWYNENNT